VRTLPDEIIVCDECGRSAGTDDEGVVEQLELAWIVDHGVEPHKHFCPVCAGAAVGP
jgi:hypothetical protein